MLYLDKPIGPIHGMMIYGDHADTSLFYYVPERPRLARSDGRPEFVYLKYRRDITDNPAFDADTKQSLGGGFMAFTVDLGVDDEELKTIKKELGRFADGEVKLAPIQFRKGSVRLTITKDAADKKDAPPGTPPGFQFFEEVYGATTPSLFGFNRATFALVLSQEAATLFEAALKSGISPIGVIYDLEFLGLRPAFDVRITANYHRVYSELDVEFGAKGQIGPVSLGIDIGAAFQRLRDKGVIKVEVINFSDDQNLRKQADAAFDWFKTQLLQDFFKSSIEPPLLVKNAGGGGGLLGQLTSLLGPLASGTTATTTTTPQPQMGPPSNAVPTPAAPPTSQSSGVISTTAANSAPSAGATGGAGGGAGGSNPSPFQVAFSLKYIDQVEDKERVFEYSMQAAEAREAAPQGLFSTIVNGLDLTSAITEVSLDDEFFNRLVATVSMGGDLNAAGINLVAVNLEYPGERRPGEQPTNVGGFIFKPDQLTPGTFTNWLNDKKDRRYRYAMDIHFKPDSPFVGKDAHVTTDWEVTSDRQLTLDPLDKIGLLDVEVSLGKIDATQIAQVQVELQYADTANAFETTKTIALKPGDAGAHWRVRLSDRQKNTYRYRILYFLADGLRYQTPWSSSQDRALVVNDPFQSTVKARLVPILDVNNLVEADVTVSYDEAASGYHRTVQKVFAGGAPLVSQEVTIPTLASVPSGFTYDVTVVRGDGSVFESGAQTVNSFPATLPIADGVGRTSRIKVKLVNPDLASASLLAVKVIVRGEGDDGDSAEALFTSSQIADQTLVLVQPGTGPLTYSYQVTGYNRQGIPVKGTQGQDSSLNLLVPLPV
jgi:hypothetical protein